MDVFSRTFLPAAAETGLAVQTASRHLPVFRRCVRPDDATILVTRCTRPDRPVSGDYLLLMTYQRLVVTRQSPLLHRLHLYLNTELRHLGNVAWNPDPRRQRLELSATAIDGVRERFLIRTDDPTQVWQLDTLLDHAFRSRLRLPRTAGAVPGMSAAVPGRSGAVPGTAGAGPGRSGPVPGASGAGRRPALSG